MTATFIIQGGETQVLPIHEAERLEYALTSQGWQSIRQQSKHRVVIEVYR